MFATANDVIRRKDKKSTAANDAAAATTTTTAATATATVKASKKTKMKKNWWSDYSCVTGNKSPRSSRIFSRSHTLPFQQKPTAAEQQYESYVQATVAANSKSPVELEPMSPAPPPPPRRHHLTPQSSKTLSPAPSSLQDNKQTQSPLTSPISQTEGTMNDAQTLCNIRQQMALSLKRMKDLEEQVKTIPELQQELENLRDEKKGLQQTLQSKNEELQRAQRTSATPSPTASAKFASPVQFTPTRISPISLESLGARLRTNSTSSERQLKSILKRDVGTMCGLHATRDVAVGSPVLTLRSVGTNPAQRVKLSELLYTQLELEQKIQIAITSYEETRHLQQLKKLISVGTQMYIPKRDLRESSVQTQAERPVLKYNVACSAKPTTRDNFVNCKPDMRTIGSSEDRTTDVLCEKCATSKRTVACGTEDAVDGQSPTKAVALKLLDLPGRSNTFSLGDQEKLNIRRKTIGTQYTPIVVHSAGSQTSLTVLHTVGVQHSPATQNTATQSQIDTVNCQTDTRDLIRLCATQTNTEEISPPTPPAEAKIVELKPTPLPPPPPAPAPAPIKPQTRTAASNTELPKTVEYGVNTQAPARTCHTASNTELVHKRDVGCGDIVKPHITIACADNYCDSCKDAIKNLAKDFSKVLASPLPTRAVDSRIPRPKHLTSPSPVRKQFQRQNTYTITPSPTPSPVAEKKNLLSSLQEKPPTLSSFHQLESSGESQSFIVEPTSTVTRSPTKPGAATAELSTDVTKKLYDLTQAGADDLIVREEKRVSISWSRDASPVPLTPTTSTMQQKHKIETSPSKSLESSYNEQLVTSTESSESQSTQADVDVSKGARKKTPSPPKSSQNVHTEAEQQQKPPSKALLQKLAMVEAEPRQKITPPKNMLAALKIINDSLLKKMAAKPFSSASLKSAKSTIQEDWFRVSSTDKANPHEVEDYLDCFENYSVPLLEYCVNMVDSNGNTAMHYAVSHANFDVVSILLDSKVCNVNQMNNAGYTCVMLVSLAKLKNSAHRTVVERLFQMADVNIRAKKHCQTALMLAVSHGNNDMVEMLLAAGADINIQDEDGSTALMCAAEHGRIDIVKHVLSQPECDSLIQDMDGSTAFKIAWQAGHRDIGLLLYVHEQMLRSKLPNRGESQRTPSLSPRQHKRQPSQ